MKHFYQNKVILITGAASGIGKRFAERITEISDVTLILWDRNPNDLKTIKEQLQGSALIHIASLDITDTERVEFEAEKIIKQKLVPDIIINCAGIVVGKYFHDHTIADIKNTMIINAFGSMLVTRLFLNEMMKRNTGTIVNLASASGYIGNPKMSVYASSKWAVLGWTESLQIEMDRLKSNIKIISVIPSYINTGMFDGVKAPLLVPILETDHIVDKIISGIYKGKRTIKAPFMVQFVPLLKALLPVSIFNWLAGGVLGVYSSMDQFEGRKPKSS